MKNRQRLDAKLVANRGQQVAMWRAGLDDLGKYVCWKPKREKNLAIPASGKRVVELGGRRVGELAALIAGEEVA